MNILSILLIDIEYIQSYAKYQVLATQCSKLDKLSHTVASEPIWTKLDNRKVLHLLPTVLDCLLIY